MKRLVASFAAGVVFAAGLAVCAFRVISMTHRVDAGDLADIRVEHDALEPAGRETPARCRERLECGRQTVAEATRRREMAQQQRRHRAPAARSSRPGGVALFILRVSLPKLHSRDEPPEAVGAAVYAGPAAARVRRGA